MMGEVVTLKPKQEKKSARKDFITVLDRPLNLGLPEPAQSAPYRPGRIKRLRWDIKRKAKALHRATFIAAADWCRRRESVRLAGELSMLAMKLNRPDFRVFVNFHGHIDGLDVYVCPRGWDRAKDRRQIVLSGKLPGFSRYGNLRLRDLREAHRLSVEDEPGTVPVRRKCFI